MRSTAIVCLVTLAGCSFVDDFDKFRPQIEGVADDGGAVPDDDAGAGVDDAGGQPRDAAPPVDTGRPTPTGDSGGNGVRDADVARDAEVPVVDAGNPGVCGDRMVDTARGETCDDGNQVPGDGCEPTTCTDTPAPTCQGAICTDRNPCTVDTCDPVAGCTSVAIDADGDGFSPGMCPMGTGTRGGDCNDGNAAIYPGAMEICDGLDNDCDPMRAIDEGLTKLRCYPDQDGDGFANLDGAGTMACACPPGRAAVDDPRDRTKHDCWDDPATRGAEVFPGQTEFFEDGYGPGGRQMRSYDYDCDGRATQKLTALPDTCGGLLGLACGAKVGYANEVPSCGEGGEYTTCGMNGLNCSGTSENRKQVCR